MADIAEMIFRGGAAQAASLEKGLTGFGAGVGAGLEAMGRYQQREKELTQQQERIGIAKEELDLRRKTTGQALTLGDLQIQQQAMVMSRQADIQSILGSDEVKNATKPAEAGVAALRKNGLIQEAETLHRENLANLQIEGQNFRTQAAKQLEQNSLIGQAGFALRSVPAEQQEQALKQTLQRFEQMGISTKNLIPKGTKPADAINMLESYALNANDQVKASMTAATKQYKDERTRLMVEMAEMEKAGKVNDPTYKAKSEMLDILTNEHAVVNQQKEAAAFADRNRVSKDIANTLDTEIARIFNYDLKKASSIPGNLNGIKEEALAYSKTHSVGITEAVYKVAQSYEYVDTSLWDRLTGDLPTLNKRGTLTLTADNIMEMDDKELVSENNKQAIMDAIKGMTPEQKKAFADKYAKAKSKGAQ